jgi:hypothetical protein
MSDLDEITGKLHHETMLRMAAEKHAEIVTRQLTEMQAERDEARRLLAASEFARAQYFKEAAHYRRELARREQQRCEGYIWGEPA